MKIDIIESESTERINFVGVNFKENVSLSQRYTDYLKQVSRVDIVLGIHDPGGTPCCHLGLEATTAHLLNLHMVIWKRVHVHYACERLVKFERSFVMIRRFS